MERLQGIERQRFYFADIADTQTESLLAGCGRNPMRYAAMNAALALSISFGFTAFPGAFKANSEPQSMFFKKGYAAAESFFEASPIAVAAELDTDEASAAGVMGCAFTTSLNSISALYALPYAMAYAEAFACDTA